MVYGRHGTKLKVRSRSQAVKIDRQKGKNDASVSSNRTGTTTLKMAGVDNALSQEHNENKEEKDTEEKKPQ